MTTLKRKNALRTVAKTKTCLTSGRAWPCASWSRGREVNWRHEARGRHYLQKGDRSALVTPPDELVRRIREAFRLGRYTLQVHGFGRMVERSIHPQTIRQAVRTGQPIEHDAAGKKGVDESVLSNGVWENRPLHVKVAERVTAAGYRHFVVTVSSTSASPTLKSGKMSLSGGDNHKPRRPDRSERNLYGNS